MQGIRRILVFCVLTTILPIILLVIPLYLRHNFYANVAYTVTESGILEINDGISTIFCSKHTIKMNKTFNAFQVSQKPEITSYRKHIRLKKSMTIPDDTLEYWGFYLLQGASVALSVCSRFEGASILLVKGERNLRTCGMLEHNYENQIVEDIFLPEAKQQVQVIFKSNAEEATIQKNFPNVNNKNSTNFHEHMKNNLSSYKQIRQKMLQDLFQSSKMHNQPTGLSQEDTVYSTKKLRHSKKKQYAKTLDEEKENNAKFNLEKHSINNTKNGTEMKNAKLNKKVKRSQDFIKPAFLLDEGVKHGGNAAMNLTNINDVSSVSSFENGLFKCYGGSILAAQEFAPSEQCTNVSYLLNGKHFQTIQNIVETGYYYYIFYSDNDIVSNDIYAVFDIYKPLLQYENVTKSCINQTKCSFVISPLSSDRVIVEIPTNDNVEYEIDNGGLLLSICHPRMEVYIIFPIAVLFFILTCAFM